MFVDMLTIAISLSYNSMLVVSHDDNDKILV